MIKKLLEKDNYLKYQPGTFKIILTYQVLTLKRNLETVQSLVFNWASRNPNCSLEASSTASRGLLPKTEDLKAGEEPKLSEACVTGAVPLLPAHFPPGSEYSPPGCMDSSDVPSISYCPGSLPPA
ncbi:hypothetical protein MC885_013107, partial [Smutsia gigantea]